MNKSNCIGCIKNYKKMYDIIKSWDNSPNNSNEWTPIWSIGYSVGDLPYFWSNKQAIEKEYECYKNVENAYQEFKLKLEIALGLNINH